MKVVFQKYVSIKILIDYDYNMKILKTYIIRFYPFINLKIF
jgi:hypothetical protein